MEIKTLSSNCPLFVSLHFAPSETSVLRICNSLSYLTFTMFQTPTLQLSRSSPGANLPSRYLQDQPDTEPYCFPVNASPKLLCTLMHKLDSFFAIAMLSASRDPIVV